MKDLEQWISTNESPQKLEERKVLKKRPTGQTGKKSQKFIWFFSDGQWRFHGYYYKIVDVIYTALAENARF